MSISAYDSSVGLPSPSSRLVNISPKYSPWSINIHLACRDPPSTSNDTSDDFAQQALHRPELAWHKSAKSRLPTIIYEGPSGVPGSLSLLEYPLPPANEGAENPGRWLWDMQSRGEVGRVCSWDRPGYGFSEMLSGADLGGVADALYQTLDQAGEIRDGQMLLVGEAYGG
jgi:pimeloyl-ACP methyl ester carboxylesterase